MLRCFLMPEQDEALKLLAAHLLLFKVGGTGNRLAALEHLRFYVENRNLNYAESGSIASVMESLLKEPELEDSAAEMARHILFLAAPDRFADEEGQKAILKYLRPMVEGRRFGSKEAEERALRALTLFAEKIAVTDKLKKAAQYLEFKLKNP